jgi:hypothetical protein
LRWFFADLRRCNFDLFAVAVVAPQLAAAPAVDAKRMLPVTGYFPPRPLQINFDLGFQAVGGQWRLFGISVATPEAPCRLRRRRPRTRANRKPRSRRKIAEHWAQRKAVRARPFSNPRAR